MAPAGRPKGPPHATRSLRLPVALWEAIGRAAKDAEVTLNAKAREWLEAMAAKSAAHSSAQKNRSASDKAKNKG